MSLQINQNISALTAHRYMQTNNDAMAKSIERLSSGLRINSAADDAAGLVISETLRTQVSGLTQASKNTQDGINMIKTTEKALDEIETQYRNVRDLALHAASSNGNASLIAADQAQANKAVESINRIADQTEFAGLKLLGDSTGSNSIEGKVFQIGANGGQTAAFSATGTQFGTDHTGGALLLTTDMHVSAVNSTFASTAGTYAKATSGAAFSNVANGDTEDFNITWERADKSVSHINFTVTNSSGGAMNIDGETTAINDALKTAGYDKLLEATNDGTNVSIGVVDRLENTAEKSDTSKLTVTSNPGTPGSGAQFGFSGASAAGTTATSGITLSSNPTDYNALLGNIDDALKKVEGLRVSLGSFQKNTLESNLASVAVTKENLSASESNIRDTDMASEMVNFTRAQILTQAGQAMMTQANQAPQNILQMLR